jgi:hypothetical protein
MLHVHMVFCTRKMRANFDIFAQGEEIISNCVDITCKDILIS